MKKIFITTIIISGLLFLSNPASAQNQKKITKAELKKCIAKKEREAKQRGYPLTDPFAARSMCLKELKEK